ncbi:MAG: NAD-dependent epimerase/dehydratase family protein [Gammaproteobacteria bacterium]
MATVLFAGFGDLGREAGRLLAGAGLHVVALRRTPDAGAPGVTAHAVDLREPFRLPPLPELPAAVVIAVSPGRHDPDDYQATYVGAVQHTLRALQASGAKPKLVLFVSSTGVWSESADLWISEDTPARPDSWTGETMLRAEQALFAGPYPAVALRLGGIYGPGRYMLVRKAEAILAGHEPVPAPAYTNRIHRDDAARMIAFLVNRALAGAALDKVYNGVDNEPSLNVDVLAYIGDLLQGRAPGETDITAKAPPPNVAVGGKRVGNARIRALGFQFGYSDFRSGYAAVVKDYRR